MSVGGAGVGATGAGVEIMQAALASQSLHVIGAVVVDELLSDVEVDVDVNVEVPAAAHI